jgi:hypothetical protein
VIRYYLASTFDRNEEMRKYRDILEERVPNCEVTSRWIDIHPDIVGADKLLTRQELNINPAAYEDFARHDLQDISNASAIINFTSGRGYGKGGRHIEFGYAYALGKRMVIVGPRENVFHTLPDVEKYDTFEEFLKYEESHGL